MNNQSCKNESNNSNVEEQKQTQEQKAYENVTTTKNENNNSNADNENDKESQIADEKKNDIVMTEVGEWIASIPYPEIRVILKKWCKYYDTFDELYQKYSKRSKAEFEQFLKRKQNVTDLSDEEEAAIIKLYGRLALYQQKKQQSQLDGISEFYFPGGYNEYLIDDISTRSKVTERGSTTRKRAEKYYGMNKFPNETCCMVAYADYEGNDSYWDTNDARSQLKKQYNKIVEAKQINYHQCKEGDKNCLFVGCHITPRGAFTKHVGLQKKFEITPSGETYNRKFLIDGAPNILIFCGFTAFLFDHGLLSVWPMPFGNPGTLRLEFSSDETIKKLKLLCVSDGTIHIGNETYKIEELRKEFDNRLIAWPNRKARPYNRSLLFRIASFGKTVSEQAKFLQSVEFQTFRNISLSKSVRTEYSGSNQYPPSDVFSVVSNNENKNKNENKNVRIDDTKSEMKYMELQRFFSINDGVASKMLQDTKSLSNRSPHPWLVKNKKSQSQK